MVQEKYKSITLLFYGYTSKSNVTNCGSSSQPNAIHVLFPSLKVHGQVEWQLFKNVFAFRSLFYI